jgi:hypothetical protein
MKPGSTLGKKYRLVRTIAAGTLCPVWAAEEIDAGREVALKLLAQPRPELRERLLREARLSARVSHPNVVRLLDVGETEESDDLAVATGAPANPLVVKPVGDVKTTAPVVTTAAPVVMEAAMPTATNAPDAAVSIVLQAPAVVTAPDKPAPATSHTPLPPCTLTVRVGCRNVSKPAGTPAGAIAPNSVGNTKSTNGKYSPTGL